MDKEENTVMTYTRDVVCTDDHPMVYYRIGYDERTATCGYCNKTFVYCDPELV